jgi:hypothetical protein
MGSCAVLLEMCTQATSFRIFSRDKVVPITATLNGIRLVGSLSSSTIGGFLYPAGGWPLPFVVCSLAVSVIYILLFAVNSTSCGMTRMSGSISICEIIAIKPLWAAFLAIPFMSGLVASLLAPLYQPLLSLAPYNEPSQAIGLIASIIPASTIPVLLLVGVCQLHKYIGAITQHALGAASMLIGLLILAPSQLFSFFSPTLPTFIIGLALIGVGAGIMMPTNPFFVLRIIERETSLTKDHVGGILAGTTASFYFAGAALSSALSSVLYEAVGFEALTVASALFCVAIVVPCWYILAPYGGSECCACLPRK